MKINNTAITFYSLYVDDDGTTRMVKTGTISNKPVRSKDRERYLAEQRKSSELDKENTE